VNYSDDEKKNLRSYEQRDLAIGPFFFFFFEKRTFNSSLCVVCIKCIK
jgi:hypothetical protein